MTPGSALLLATDIIVIAGTLYLISILLSVHRTPPFIATRKGVVHEIVEAFGRLPHGSVFYDLGSGDGRIVFAIARANPGATCIGIEKHFVPYALSRLRARLHGLPNARFRKGDIFREDLSKATHIYAYLYPSVMDALLPRFEAELGPGTFLASLDFAFSGKEPSSVLVFKDAGTRTLGTRLSLYCFDGTRLGE